MIQIRTVAIIADNQFFRESAAYFLAQHHYVVLDLGPNEAEVEQQLLRQRPDCLLLHTCCSSGPGASALRCIREHHLATKTIAYGLSAAASPVPLHGYLTPADGLAAMFRCVAVLGNGATDAAPPRPAVPAATLDRLAGLTSQELKILALIGKGLGSSQLADELFVSKHTIKNHKTNITRKLAVTSCRDLLPVALALHNHPSLASLGSASAT
jgi:DNA-binding NarL/FixJ family response regulator